jgi:protein SCO1/2
VPPRFHAGPNWNAAAPSMAELPRIDRFLDKGEDSDHHSTQVQILDRGGCLVWRMYELPTPG